MADRMAIRTVRHADGKFGYSFQFVDYAPQAEDFAWCERELGNVEVCTTWMGRMAEQDPLTALAFAFFQGQEPVREPVNQATREYFGENVSAETLERAK